MQRLKQVGNTIVRSTGRQRILDQIVGTDCQKVDMGTKRFQHDDGRRNLHHDTDFNFLIEGNSFSEKFLLSRLNESSGLDHFIDIGNHGEDNLQIAVGTASQDGPDLLPIDVRVAQAKTNSSQTQRGVGLSQDRGKIRMSFASEVQGSNVGGTTSHHRGQMLIDLELLLFTDRLLLVLHVDVFCAKQPDPSTPQLESKRDLTIDLYVGIQINSLAIRSQTGEAVSHQLLLNFLFLPDSSLIVPDFPFRGSDLDHS